MRKSESRPRLIGGQPEGAVGGVVRVNVTVTDPYHVVQSTRVFFAAVSKPEPRVLPMRTNTREIITAEPPRLFGV